MYTPVHPNVNPGNMSALKQFFKTLGNYLTKLMKWIEQGQAKAPACKT